MIKCWNRLPRYVLAPPFLEILKTVSQAPGKHNWRPCFQLEVAAISIGPFQFRLGSDSVPLGQPPQDASSLGQTPVLHPAPRACLEALWSLERVMSVKCSCAEVFGNKTAALASRILPSHSSQFAVDAMCRFGCDVSRWKLTLWIIRYCWDIVPRDLICKWSDLTSQNPQL